MLPHPVALDDLLEPFSRRGVDLGLERLQAALADAGHPEQGYPAVQVAGTNGKGSICALLGSILQQAGLRCGLYRSPHLLSWCERLQVGGDWISPQALRATLQAWTPRAQAQQLTPFELLTGAAFSYFASASVDIAVLEVGLGGRLDATTCHPDRRVLGIASIGLDHCEHLGPDLASIAREKAGIFCPGAVAFSAPQAPEVTEVLQQQATERHCRLVWVEPLGAEVTIGLLGEWQRSNGAVAVAMAQELAAQGWAINAAAIQQGLAQARWCGRLQRCRFGELELLVDGAHNPPAAEALRQSLDAMEPQLPRHWLLGIQRHKDGVAMVRALLAGDDQAWVAPIAGSRSWSAAELQSECPDLASQLHHCSDAKGGLKHLLGSAAQPVVAGALYLLGELWNTLESDACS